MMQTCGTRVLIVDDDPASRRLLEVRLRPLECDVLTANNGEQALATIRNDVPDLVLLDLQMPRMGGMDVLRAMRHEGIEDEARQLLREALRGNAGLSSVRPVLAPLGPVAPGVCPERVDDERERGPAVRVVVVRGAGGCDETAARCCDEMATHVGGVLRLRVKP